MIDRHQKQCGNDYDEDEKNEDDEGNDNADDYADFVSDHCNPVLNFVNHLHLSLFEEKGLILKREKMEEGET